MRQKLRYSSFSYNLPPLQISKLSNMLSLNEISKIIDNNKYAFQLLQQISPQQKFIHENKDIVLNVIGWTNKTCDGKYLLFIDMDKSRINSKTKAVIKTMSNDYGSFYFIRTHHGYHIINFSKLSWKEYIYSLAYLVWNDIEDYRHFLISAGRQISVLRLNDDFTLNFAILNKSRYELSKPHILLFSLKYGTITELYSDNLDNCDKVQFDMYHRDKNDEVKK